MRFLRLSLLLPSIAGAAVLTPRGPEPLDECPGYHASDVHESGNGLTAHLHLAGKACNTYGDDLRQLKLVVEYETDSRLHIKISDQDEDVYQVPESVFPRPEGSHSHRNEHEPLLKFSYEKKPFSFSVSRQDTGEVLFDTKDSNLIFQSQYLNLRTALPKNPYLFGLGEHTDPFRLNTSDYTLTSWNRDAYGVSPGTNLYSTQPVYIEQRKSGSHGVFLLNSNGVDFKIDKDEHGKQYLEYNIIGGVFDFYFLAGPTPKEVASQYAEVSGFPAMMPYWGFGFHQCRYGYRDVYDVAEVVYNYSQAKIPLETMWTDIDYMDGRRVFTLDPDRFPLEKMRELVGYLHDHDQHYVVMVDPAVSYSDNPAFNHGKEQDIFMKEEDGSIYKGAVWPGVTAFPDWFHPDTGDYWTNEFAEFFSAKNGVDIDALWIDMNEASNFCPWPCSDPKQYSEESDLPPDPPAVRPNPRPLPGFPSDFQPPKSKRESNHGKKLGLPNRDLINPPYAINNEAGSLSNKTASTNLVHANGLVEYDTHNLYGIMMSIASRDALLHRRPSKRPLIITRSTYAGAGSHVGKWLGDNLSTWQHYRVSIAQMLAFASVFQVPMIGSDVCGFGGNTDDKLCARWTTLGAFYPFFRNHNGLDSISQEFYRWDSVAETARSAIERRYKLLDYIYTAFHHQVTTGEPLINPLFYIYPEDENTYPIDLQFFYGDAILVSPVTDDNSTSVDIYLPDDIFYEYSTGKPVRGRGEIVHLDNVSFTDIPLHIRGGTIIPLRKESADTTTELRKKPFELIIAPDSNGKASGSLYIDDGESIEQPLTIDIKFNYHDGKFKMDGKFDLKMSEDIMISSVSVLGVDGKPSKLSKSGGEDVKFDYYADNNKVTANVDLPLTGPAEIDLS